MATRRTTAKKKAVKRKSPKRQVQKAAAGELDRQIETFLERRLRVTCGLVSAAELGSRVDMALYGCGFGFASRPEDSGSIATVGPYSPGDTLVTGGTMAGSYLGQGHALVGPTELDPIWYSGNLDFSAGSVTLPTRVGSGKHFCLEVPFEMKGFLVGSDALPVGPVTEYFRRDISGAGRVEVWGYESTGLLWIYRMIYCFCDEAPAREVCLSMGAYRELLDRIRR